MKTQFTKSFLLLAVVLSSFIFNSCAENVPGDPNLSTQNQSMGKIEIKILSGPEKNKVFKSAGAGAVIGTKRTMDNVFMGYQIVGTFQNVGFGCTVTNENGEENFGDIAINFYSSMTEVYTSVENTTNTVKITDIKLLQKYQDAGAQLMNGKLTFKGMFVKENGSSTSEEMLVEGTITF